jgi:hypothetical protein
MLDVMTSPVTLLAAAASAGGGRCSSFACLLAFHNLFNCLAALTARVCGSSASEALVLPLLLLAMICPAAAAAAAVARVQNMLRQKRLKTRAISKASGETGKHKHTREHSVSRCLLDVEEPVHTSLNPFKAEHRTSMHWGLVPGTVECHKLASVTPSPNPSAVLGYNRAVTVPVVL